MTFAEFESDYNDRASDMFTGRQNDYQLRLHDWLNVIDDSEYSRAIVAEIEGLIDFAPWYRKLKTSQHPNTPIDWANDRSIRLAQQLGLVREFAVQGAGSYGTFALQFLNSRAAVADTIERVNSSIVQPLARELLKLIKARQQSLAQISIPHASSASRSPIIVLDHTAAAYRELMEKLEEVRRIAETSNALATTEPEERDRVVAELNAGQTLLKAPRLRVSAVWEVLKGALEWMRSKTVETAYAVAITALIALLAAFLGMPIPGL